MRKPPENRVLSNAEAAAIRTRWLAGESQSALGAAFEIHKTTVGKIVRGETYPDAGGLATPAERDARNRRKWRAPSPAFAAADAAALPYPARLAAVLAEGRRIGFSQAELMALCRRAGAEGD